MPSRRQIITLAILSVVKSLPESNIFAKAFASRSSSPSSKELNSYPKPLDIQSQLRREFGEVLSLPAAPIISIVARLNHDRTSIFVPSGLLSICSSQMSRSCQAIGEHTSFTQIAYRPCWISPRRRGPKLGFGEPQRTDSKVQLMHK